MTSKPLYYRWEWDLAADPVDLWPLVADTNRFDRDTGIPAYVAEQFEQARPLSQRRRLEVRFLGVPLAWVEEPFEWLRPYHFGVTRHYEDTPLNPLQTMRIRATLEPIENGGTHLIYEVWATPRNWLGYLAIPLVVGQVFQRRFAAAFRRYAQVAVQAGAFLDMPAPRTSLVPGGQARLRRLRQQLLAQGIDEVLLDRLLTLIEQGDDLDVERIRPYALADHWGTDRRALLELCLEATRVGLLDSQWDLLCPSCRGPRQSVQSLADVTRQVHCDACNLDYQAEFDQSVELVFQPNRAIRVVPERLEFCTAGPQATPHIVAQQLLPPDDSRQIAPQLANGRYRLRTLLLDGTQSLEVAASGDRDIVVQAQPDGVVPPESCVVTHPGVTLQNQTDKEQLFILEEMGWADTAATAADVTLLQKFRDLFARESLRPGDQIAVGSLTVLFTDLCDSTQLYREIGDAPAFGLVMSHFDVLREAINDEDGVLVKTIGDAVMAVFRRPVSALRAVYQAQMALAALTDLAERPLRLKAAVHHGPAIAVTLNDRLDYFGSTVNIASRLEKFASGNDVIISERVYDDPEVADLLARPQEFPAEPFRENLKGFDETFFALWRLRLPEMA